MRTRKMHVSISATIEHGRGGTFEACVKGRGLGRKEIGVQRCATGSNPRKALAEAMHDAARVISYRKGAFAGYSKSHRRTRRTRRGSKRRS